ncbi:phospholipase D-like domain-containing protein [Pleionea sediminis]|uniref:phospholipase D-like domain-containing protein n=1 Tax=Pleionea sediminis TaxID=2569479 RepID=UPI0013DE6E9D|nr:phospholipase D family protein [Pleionea sediminis]
MVGKRQFKPTKCYGVLYIRFILFVCLLLVTLATTWFFLRDDSPSLKPTTHYCDGLEKNHSEKLSDVLRPFRDKLAKSTGVFPLETGTSAILTRAWLSDAAEKSIDVQYFIFSKDNVGLIAFDYLVHAADRGIQVRVLVDDFMVEFEEREILAMASHPNISIKIYNPGVNLGKNFFEKIKKFATDFDGANQRMHNKLFIVDGQVLITGGRNIEGMYFDFNHRYNFRDRDVLLLGQAAEQGQRIFNQYWNHQLSVDVTKILEDEKEGREISHQFERLHEYACNPQNYWPQIREQVRNLSRVFHSIQKSGDLVWTESANMVCDSPNKMGESGSNTAAKLIDLIANAKQSVDIQTPYLVTSESTRMLFKAAVDKGVNVRILTNSLASTDNVEAFSGYQRDRDELLATGVHVFEFRPDAKVRLELASSELQEELGHTAIFGTHAKTLVVDEKVTVIGSFNLDPRSAYLNTECLAIIDDRTIAEKVLQGIEEEFKPENAWKITPNWNPDDKVDLSKRLKTYTRYIIPKDVL